MADQAPQATRPSRRTGGFTWTPRIIITIVLAVLLLIFALGNLEHVDVSLVFWEVNIRLVWALLLFAVIGVVIGLVAPRFRTRARR